MIVEFRPPALVSPLGVAPTRRYGLLSPGSRSAALPSLRAYPRFCVDPLEVMRGGGALSSQLMGSSWLL
jgi:hypothetical protein